MNLRTVAAVIVSVFVLTPPAPTGAAPAKSWIPDADLVKQLGPVNTMAGFQFRMAQGYKLATQKGPMGAMAYACRDDPKGPV